MTAAFEQSIEAKQSARLKSIAEQVAQPTVAGRNGRKPLKPEHQKTWNECVDVVAKDAYRSSRATDKFTLAWQWREQCRSAGITFGWILGRILFRLLVELASRWIEANQTQMKSGDAPS